MPRDIQKNNSTRDRVLHSAATLFLERGYAKASIREIAKHAGANRGSVLHVACNSKETLLQALVPYVLEGQFRQTQEFLAEKAADPVLFYAAETTLQLYMMENSEQIRELYLMAYRLPDTAEIIRLLV